MPTTDNIDRELARLDERITLAIAELDRLREWQATITAILGKLELGGLRYDEIPNYLRALVSEVAALRIKVAQTEDEKDDLPF